MRHTRVLSLVPVMLVTLFISACSSSQNTQSPASFTSRPTIASSPAPSPAELPAWEPSDTSRPTVAPSPAPTAGGSFEPELPQTEFAPPPPPSAPVRAPKPAAEPTDRAVQRLITRNAEWHAPASLTEGETDNIALSIGDVQRLQDMINATVPTDVPRPPLPITVTVGTIVRAKLAVISSDATVTPLDTIDKSIGDEVSILFSWTVQPHVSGELELQAFISCPRADGNITTETVPFRIPVHPAAKPAPGVGDRLHGLLETLKNYWVQLTALAGGLAAAARFGSKWYRRREAANKVDGLSEGAAVPPTASRVRVPQVTPGHLQPGGHADPDGEPDDSDDLGVGVGVPQRDHQDRRAEQR